MNGSYISNYRALNPSATQGKTDLEIALALLAADPTLALRVPEIGRLKKQADDRASIRSGAAYGQNIAASNINATAQKAQQQLDERGWIERSITDPTRRGLLMAEQADLLMNDLQIGKGLTREKVRKLTEIRDKMDAIRASPEFREFQEAEGLKEGWSEFWGWSETPTIIAEVVTESMSALLSYGAEKIFGGAAAGAGTGAALGAAGGPVAPATATAGAIGGAGYGAMAGLGLTSYGLAASSKYMQALEETVGSEVMDNPDLLFEAMKDPEIHKKANAKAVKYGVPIAAIDTISAGMAGRSIAWGRKLSSSAYTKASKIPAESLLQQTAKQGLLGTAKAAPKAVPLGFQMAMGSGGETLGQLSSEGKVENWKDVFIEGIAELGMAPFEMSASKIGEAMTPDMHKALNDRIRIKRKQGVTSDEQKESIDGFVKEGTLTAQQAEIYKDHVDSVYTAEFEGRTPPEEEGAKGGMSKKDAAEIVNAFIRGEITEEGLAVRASETEGSEPVREEFIIGPSDASLKRFKELVAEDAKSGEDKAGEYAKKNNIEIRELTKEENRQLSNEGLKLEAAGEGGYKLDTDGVIGTEPDRPRNVGDKSPEEIKAGAAEAKEKSASNRSFRIFSQHGITEPNPSLESLFDEGRDKQLSAVESIIQTTDDKVTKSDMKDEVAALGDLLSPRERDLSLAFIDNQQFDTTPDDLPFAEWSAASLDETGFLIRSQAEEGAVQPEVKVKDPDATAPSEMTWEENWRRKNNISPDEPLPDYAKILMAQESRWRADIAAQQEAATKARKATETMPKSDLPLFGGALDVDPSVQSEKQSASKSVDQASFDKKKMAELRSRESEIFNRIYFTPQSIRLGGLFGDEVIPAEGNVGVEVTDAERSALKKELVSIEDQIVSLGGRIDPTGTQASGVHPIYNKEITNELPVEDFGLFAVKNEKHHRTGEKISRLDIWRMTALSAARHYANIFEAPPLQQPIEDVAWDAFTSAVGGFYRRIQNHKEMGRPDIMDLDAVGDLYKWSGKQVIWSRVKDAADSQGSELRRITPPQGRHDRKKGRTIKGEHTRMGRDWMAPRTLGISERISEAAEEIANDYLESVELGGESQMVPKTVEGGDPVPIVGVTEPTGSTLRTPESIRLVEEAKGQLAKFISDFMDRVMSKGFTQKDAPAWTAGAFEREVFETILLQATANAIRVRNRANRNLIGKRRKLNSLKGRVRRIRATLGHLHGKKLDRVLRFFTPELKAVRDEDAFGGWTVETIGLVQETLREQGVYPEDADINIKVQQSEGGRATTANLKDFIGELRAQNNILSQEVKKLEKQIAKAEAQPDLATRGFRLPESKAEAGAPRSVPKAIQKLLNDYNKQREAMELAPLEMPKRFVSEYMLGDKKNKSSAHNIMLKNMDAVLREMELWGKWDMDEVAANMELVDRTFAEDSVEQVGDLLDKHPLTAEGRGTHTVSEAIDKVLAANPKLKGTYSDSVINFTKSIADRLGIGIHLAEIKHTRTKADGTSETKYRAAVYLSSTDQIAVYPKIPEEVLLKSLIEETMHAVAVNGIMNDRDLSNEAKSLYQDAKEAWEGEMAQAQQTIDKSELGSGDEMINAEIAKNRLDELRSFSYAFSNHWEFLAHGLYQVDLQKWLNSRGRKAGIATSWWNRFKDMIMRALDSFGEKIEAGSYLSEVLDMNAKGLAERLDWQEGADATNADPNTIEGRFTEPASQNWKGNDVVLTQFNLKYDTNLLETMDIEHQGRTIHKGIKVLNQNPESANKPAKSIEEKWAPIHKANEDAQGDSMLFAEDEVTPETSGKETLEGIKSKIETPEGREGVIRSEMSMYEKFREKFITSGAILDTFQSTVFKALNIAGKTRVALSELFELQAGSPVKADHRTNNFMLRIHDKIGGSPKNESNFNVYALIRRIEDRITHDDDPNLEAKIDELMANMDSESGAWMGTEEQKLDLINLITKSKEVGDFKKLADLPKLGLALDEFVNEINDPNLIRFVRDEDGEIVRANGVARTEGAFEDAIGVYQEEMASGLYDLYRADIISGTSYNRISRSSSFYMPFYVVKYFNQDPKDTFGEFIRGIKTEDFGLISALDAAQFKLYNTQLRIDRNAFMQELERFRTDFDPDETFMRKTKTLDERVMPSNMKPVKWHENGKNRYLWIDEDVADVLTRFDPVSTSMTYDVMKRAGDIFKMGATGVNVFFQAGNMLLLDPVRLLTTSKGGLRAMDKGLNPFVLAMQYLRAIGASSWANLAPNSVKNLIRRVRPEAGRDADALYDEFINSGAAGSTIAEYLGKATAIKDPITRYNRKSKLNWMLAKLNQLGKAMEQTAKLVGLQRMKVFEGIDDLADRIDSATGAKKVALQNEMKDRMRAISVEIRNFAGSPDFMRKGKFTENEALNVLFLFFNARVQGVERDLNRLSKVFSSNPQDRKLGAGVMLKMTAFAAMPTAIAWALNRRDEDRERDYAEVSDEEKKRYFMIPLDSFFEHPYIEGKMVRDYIRIPRRESFGLFSYTIEKGLDHMYDKDPAAVSEILTHWAESTFPINIHGIPEGDIGKGIESMASNLNPILRAPAELIGNRNFFRRKPIVPISMVDSDPSEQYYNTTPEIYKGYGISPLKIKHTLEALTAGGITQFLPPKDVGDGGVGRRIASAPLISRLARSTFLAEDEITEIMDDADMMDATARVIRRRAVSKFMTDTRGLSIQDRVRAIPPATNNDERLRNEGIIRRLREIALGLDDDEIRMKNSTVNVRSSVIVSRIQDMTPAEVKVYLTDLANKRILTRDVGRDLALKLHARGESIHDYLREPVR